jgi:hypothetical protein
MFLDRYFVINNAEGIRMGADPKYPMVGIHDKKNP